MMNSQEMWAVFEGCIEDYHQEDKIDAPEKNPYPDNSFEALLYAKNWIDTVQWHLEDEIRAPFIEPTEALILKRRIDKSNQNRTDLVEQIDERVVEQFAGVEAEENAPLNTESPGWAIDRLSILALKIYHMQVEATRDDIAEDLLLKNQNKLAILKIQKDDLSLAIDQLLKELAEGKRVVKVYRQMKMYNDPQLNPVLYKKR